MKFKNVLPFMSFFFLVCSFPFIYFPMTDADILHWLPIAKEIQVNLNFFTTAAFDQAHGPLLAWGSGIFSKLLLNSFYGFAVFNILCGVLGVFLIYYFSFKLWENESISKLAAFLMSTSLSIVYFAKTPMYDLPATIMFFSFSGFYLLYVIKNKRKYLLWSLLFVGLGSLSRFSIVLGLSGIYLILVNFIYRRSIFKMVFDGIAVIIITLLFNMPWLYGQYIVHGKEFLDIFMIDNFYRYIKEPGEGAKTYRNYYGFTLYVFIGLIPHSFSAMMTIFQKRTWASIKGNKIYQALLAAFLPCLIAFSFSGHVKLARYIAYVFPMLLLFLSHHMYTYDLLDGPWRKRTRIAAMGTLVFLTVLFLILIIQFSSESQEGFLMVCGIIALIFFQILFMARIINKNFADFRVNATKYLLPIAISYLVFSSVLTYESLNASFLTKIRDRVINIIY